MKNILGQRCYFSKVNFVQYIAKKKDNGKRKERKEKYTKGIMLLIIEEVTKL